MSAEEAISSISNGFANPNPVSGSNPPPPIKKKRNLPGTPDPEAEVIALSPKTLMATNRFLCEICGKGFQRDQNLQLHRRGHNLPWKLKQRTTKEARKRVYVCPEKSCVHHHPSRALGDLTGIKKHFCRKHGEKKWKCEKCSKRYAVQSDWKAHSKTCGTREYKCDCGTLFSRRDSFITHRAFCDALAEETARVNAATSINSLAASTNFNYHLMGAPIGPNNMAQHFSSIFKPISSSNDQQTIDQTRRGLPLWVSQGPQGHEAIINNSIQEIHRQLGSLTSSGTIFGQDPLVSSSDQYHQINWPKIFGNNKQISSNNVHQEELTSTTSLPLNEAAVQLASVPSLYSGQQQQTHQTTTTAAANMSATALLQKAAQIGATSTDPSFLGSFGLKCSSNGQIQEGNKFCGLYGANNLDLDLVLDHQMQMFPATKRQKVMQNEPESTVVGGGGGQTRDFLGVGVQQAICHPSPMNGWI
ncbi:hypothetical protein JCGZ_25730 [Jatropha curcas]|uniref:C2H2-type domain-containing protein n=1 Tax=Jatropha curcas TaxID=180498 RepID=A0A067JMK9_JATCU|nr:zinc finger protein NUTCRACKER [Jatropha curcas]KDP24073.1 hypothetical protein JCGZ_25730 [Jatropha curcas]